MAAIAHKIREWIGSTPADASLPVKPKSASETQETRWRGASRVLRSLRNWFPSIGSPTSDLPSNEQRTLRARSRDAFRSNTIGRAALTRSRTNIVGTGLMCRPSVDAAALGISEEEAEQINAQIRAAWEMWAEDPLQCDQESTLDFYGLQGLALLSSMASGDAFALTPNEARPGGTCELKVQLIEADRVSNPNDWADTPECIDGVELHASGQPLGYWVRSSHPGDKVISAVPATWSFFKAVGEETGRRRVLHIWNDKERPGQVRGVPFLAPVLEPLKQLERFSDAELMAAVVSSFLTLIIEKNAEATDSDGNPLSAFGDAESTASATNPAGDPITQSEVALGPAAVVDLAVGEKANLVNPLRPNSKFDGFFVAIVKQIGAALEIPLDELLLQYDKSYSAARAAMLQAWRFFNMRRWILVQQFCAPIYGLFLDEQVAAGKLKLPGYADPARRRAFSRAMWIGPARGAMDELKEANAAKTRIEIGVSNESIETAAMTGEDWHAVYGTRVREIRRRKEDGTYVAPKGAESDAPNFDPADLEPFIERIAEQVLDQVVLKLEEREAA